MTSSAKPGSSVSSEINVTPLIDVLLVLLIIFMVIVPLAPRGMTAQTPQTSATTQPAGEQPIVLEVRGTHDAPTYSLNRVLVSHAELPARLQATYRVREQKTLFVAGDAALDFDVIADAIGAAKQASVTTVGVLTPRDRQR